MLTSLTGAARQSVSSEMAKSSTATAGVTFSHAQRAVSSQHSEESIQPANVCKCKIEALTSEVNEAAAALKAKKAELKDAQKQLAKIEKQEAALAEQAAQNQRKADAEKLATAFLESGKSLDEVLRALQ